MHALRQRLADFAPIVLLLAITSTREARAQTSKPWMDATLTPAQRATLLVSVMSTSQQLAIVHGAAQSTYVGHTQPVAELGIPALNLEDGPAGVADGMTQVTAFPAPITLAASFDPSLAERYGEALAAEEAAKGANVLLGPMMNVDRSPFAGRNFEGFGEDPALAAALASAIVKGIQSQGVIATAKHFLDNDQETARMTIDVHVDDRTQHEIYLSAFEACVQAGVGAVMCSYNKVNGTYACENPQTQLRWLEGELGYSGFIMSDWTAAHSAAPSANAGLDLEMPGETYFGQALAAAASAAAVSQSRIADMAHRILTSMFAAGLFDRAPSGSAALDVRSTEHTTLARDVAAAGAVLLKNAGPALPIDPRVVHSIAVIGAAADASPIVVGGGSASVAAPSVTTPLAGIKARAPAGVQVAYDSGGSAPFASAASLAKTSDIVVVVVGTTSSEGTDRSSLSLPAPADDLVATVAAANPKTVVVVYAPSQVTLPWAASVAAILYGGMPGQEEGSALAQVLFGDVNPAGRLPFTLAASAADYPAQTAAQFPGVSGVVTYSEGLNVGYRYFDDEEVSPLYPFGYGLSYTSFGYANLAITPGAVNVGQPVSVSFDLTNTGSVAGSEVAQLYLGMPPEASEPPRQLRAFKKIALDPGATEHVTFALDARAMSFWSAGFAAWIAVPGAYAISVGGSSRSLPLAGSFTLAGGPLAGTGYLAESAALSGGAEIAKTQRKYSGAGFISGLPQAGASATFSVVAGSAGPCNVAVRYSADLAGATLAVGVNGAAARQTAFPGLANLDTWDFVSNTLDLKAGTNTITYRGDGSSPAVVNVDEILVCVDQASPDASLPPTQPGASAPSGATRSSGSGFGCACSQGVRATEFDGSWAAAVALSAALFAAVRRKHAIDRHVA